ncbi:HK97 gp10 family phage protein [Amycolatopsis dendrobii]|uniref:HK97 gp10 family phage protein n=1 Tax=Amycolatopsis dendrobii TaxID=2760662 RepID=A0A7W3VUP3_9PSEU|nr:HK97 gp10 family phage protein [Amycolatopsis dendrobii]MBB1153518.1 HK97 gp10 family phage protein [Amycolatopsis dendrobii]
MARYEPDSAGFTRLATSRRVSRHMTGVVGRYWADELRALAPTLFHRNTGEYIDSITVEPTVVEINGLPRAAVIIAANTRYAAILEIGSKDIDVPPRPLTKLLDRIEDADPGQARKHRG